MNGQDDGPTLTLDDYSINQALVDAADDGGRVASSGLMSSSPM